jgi:DNA-binding MarR family transcriptional regulator
MRDHTGSISIILLEVLARIERTAPGLSMGQLAMLLHIVQNEGVRVSDLARLCGVSDATVSRSVRAMAAAGEPGALEPAHGLIELLRGADGRARHLALTPRGLQLTRQLAGALKGDFDEASPGENTSAAVTFSILQTDRR